ncbi:hypothetical protein D5S17_22020 [Pseudonocardiaceae bacterium YIM PH 21723]|nr:hypothetical protein D5S17_22020 [Pseudonocardiaceae bacterium YIM PH 21723]
MGSASGAALGFACCLITVISVIAGGARSHPLTGLVAFAVVVAALGFVTRLPGALPIAGQGWAFYAGFVTGRTGVLHFDHAAMVALGVLVAVALVASLLGAWPERGFHPVDRPERGFQPV